MNTDRLTYKPGRENKWVKWHEMSEEDQNVLRQAGKINCLVLDNDGAPKKPKHSSPTSFDQEFRYLLKPDYVPERETVDVGICLSKDQWLMLNGQGPLEIAMRHVNFKHYLWPNGDTARYLKWEVTKDVKVVFYKD